MKKASIAIELLKGKRFSQWFKSLASYHSSSSSTAKQVEPHLQMLQQRENLTVAEIGVWKGHNAQRLCKVLDIEKMYLIDPYDKYEEWDFPFAHKDITAAEEKLEIN